MGTASWPPVRADAAVAQTEREIINVSILSRFFLEKSCSTCDAKGQYLSYLSFFGGELGPVSGGYYHAGGIYAQKFVFIEGNTYFFGTYQFLPAAGVMVCD